MIRVSELNITQYIYALQTLELIISLVAIQCQQHLYAVQFSLKPPSARLPRLSADTAAKVPNTTFCVPWIVKANPFS